VKTITINDRGVFVQESYRLTAHGIVKRRRLIQGQILRLRRDIQDRQLSVSNMEKELANLVEQLEALNSPLVESFLEKDRKQKEEIQRKAQAILRELVGDRLFEELELKKRIIFTAKDGMTYKIESNGNVFRKVNKQWQRLCIIRPNDLPLPDFVLSLFFSIKENPKNYQLRRR